jgi:nucleoside phosphorylase
MAGRGRALIGVVSALVVMAALVPLASARTTHHHKPKCATTRVLLLGTYPAEIRANLALEKLAAKQPTVVDGHDFYVGTLEGRPAILGLAVQSPADAYATTKLAIRHFSCLNAVVLEGTAGGGSTTEIGDVVVPSEWTNNGAPFIHTSPRPLALAESLFAKNPPRLLARDVVNDGGCSCDGPSFATAVAVIIGHPQLIVGGAGITDGTGGSDTCTAGGGALEGCNPCPPCPPAELSSGTALSASSYVADSASAPKLTTSDGIAPAGYLADDQQTNAVQKAANQAKLPFIAFRGISDTSAVGDLWPAEFAIYQQLAADNAAIVARDFIAAWRG